MDWKKIIEDKKTEFQTLWDRMDKDRELAFAYPYKVKDKNGKEVPGIANVTLPEPKVFLEKCVARLTGVQSQTLVEGKGMTDRQTTKIEEFLDDFDFEANELLSKKGEKDEVSALAEQVTLRGRAAEQIVVRIDEGGQFIADVRNLDTRYLCYESDYNGVKWFSPIMKRSKADILAEYGITVKDATAEVWDCWDDEFETVFIAGLEAKKNKNPYGFVPCVIQIPPCGSSLRDENWVQYKGESVFALLRNSDGESIFDECNFMASMLKTMVYDMPKPGLMLRNEDGMAVEVESYPGDPGSVADKLGKSKFELIPKRDLTNATRYYKQIIDTIKSIATYTLLDFGATTFPMSAVALTKLAESKNELLLPRLDTIARIRQQRSKMVIKQVEKLGTSIELGEEGHKREYKPTDLMGEYVIKYRFSSNSKEDMASDAAVANSLRGIYSEDTILRDILKVKNPDGEQAKKQIEEFRRNDPIGDLYLTCLDFADKAETDPTYNQLGWIALERLENLMKRQKLNIGVPLANEPNTKTPVANANSLPALFSGGGVSPSPAMLGDGNA